MEAKFCTVSRCSGDMYKELVRYEGWKPSFFRRFCVTTCILVIIIIAAVQTLLMSGRGGISGQAGIFFIFSAFMVVMAFIVEWRTLKQRMERVVAAKAAKRMRQAGRAQGDKEEIYWYDDYCVIEDEDMTSRYQYTGLRTIKEEENMYSLLLEER